MLSAFRHWRGACSKCRPTNPPPPVSHLHRAPWLSTNNQGREPSGTNLRGLPNSVWCLSFGDNRISPKRCMAPIKRGADPSKMRVHARQSAVVLYHSKMHSRWRHRVHLTAVSEGPSGANVATRTRAFRTQVYSERLRIAFDYSSVAEEVLAGIVKYLDSETGPKAASKCELCCSDLTNHITLNRASESFSAP